MCFERNCLTTIRWGGHSLDHGSWAAELIVIQRVYARGGGGRTIGVICLSDTQVKS